MRIKFGKDTKHVLDSFKTHVNSIDTDARHTLFEIGKLFDKELRDGIKNPPKSGKYYSKNGRRVRASKAGEYPANRTGRLRKSSNFRVVTDRKMIVGLTASYAKFLEEGTVRMEPRPMLELTAERIEKRAFEIARKRMGEKIKRA